MFSGILPLIPPMIIMIPFLTAGLVYVFCQERPAMRDCLLTGATFLPLVLASFLYGPLQQGEIFERSFSLLPPLGLSLRVDLLSFYILLLFVFFGFVISLYSQHYMREDGELRRFYTYVLLVLCGCYGVALAGDFFTFYLFFEFMSIMFFVLVIHQKSEAALKAGLKFLFMTIIAGIALFLAAVIVLRETGSLSFGQGGLITTQSPLTLLAFAGFIIAFGTKAALFPLHIWMPDAYTFAPLPAVVLSSTIMLKTGAYGLIRVFGDIYGYSFLEGAGWSHFLIYLASFTILFGSAIALVQDDLIRRLAYSGIAQVGYIILGIAILKESALVGAVYHIMAHAFMKGTMFLCAGAVMKEIGTRKISEMKGAGHKIPAVMLCFSVAALTAVGMPPFNIFISKWHLSIGALEGNMPVLVVILLLSSFLNAAYYLPIVINAFLGHKGSTCKQEAADEQEAAATSQHKARGAAFRDSWKMTVPILILTLGCVIFGLMSVNWPLELVRSGVKVFF